MFLNDAVGDGQSKSGAVADPFGRKERVEDLGQIFRRNAFAGVFQAKERMVEDRF